ncbi:hypothetical protein MNB_SV-5-1668 [hydrothermal vent metagenome]|uniref:Lipoprotein n=1 Tax=hydrothermal vent metagenome TaxID=652676 RepID=A0A1W1EDC1_9ZZZZ
MFDKKYHLLLCLSATLIFTACGSSNRVQPQPYKPLDLSKKSENYKQGASDGCSTAAETYKKDHEAFNNDFEYNEGWWAGRRNCEGRSYAEY